MHFRSYYKVEMRGYINQILLSVNNHNLFILRFRKHFPDSFFLNYHTKLAAWRQGGKIKFTNCVRTDILDWLKRQAKKVNYLYIGLVAIRNSV